MRNRLLHLAVLGAAALAALAVLGPPDARSQINAAPSWVPVGVSSSGSGSTVWFHEPSSRQTVACHTSASAGGGLAPIHCVSAKLP